MDPAAALLRTLVLLVLAVLGAVSPGLRPPPAVEGPARAHPPLLRPGFLLDPRPARRHRLGAGHAQGQGPTGSSTWTPSTTTRPPTGRNCSSCSGKNTRAPGSTASSSPTTTPSTWSPATGPSCSPHPGGRLRHQRSRLHPGRCRRPVQHHRKHGARGHAHRGPAPESQYAKNFRAGRRHPERPSPSASISSNRCAPWPGRWPSRCCRCRPGTNWCASLAKRTRGELLYLLVYFQDAAGGVHGGGDPRLISGSAPDAPVYVAWDFQLDSAAVGGCVTSGFGHGRRRRRPSWTALSNQPPAIDLAMACRASPGRCTTIRRSNGLASRAPPALRTRSCCAPAAVLLRATPLGHSHRPGRGGYPHGDHHPARAERSPAADQHGQSRDPATQPRGDRDPAGVALHPGRGDRVALAGHRQPRAPGGRLLRPARPQVRHGQRRGDSAAQGRLTHARRGQDRHPRCHPA